MKKYALAILSFLVLGLLSSKASSGTISFVEPQSLPLAFFSDGSVSGLAKGDFDGNGKLDVSAVYSAGGVGYVGVFTGEGNGGFKSPVILQLPTGVHNTVGICILAGYFDKDGRVDLVVSATDNNGVNSILFFKGRGDGTFTSPVQTVLSTGGAPFRVQAADLNGDEDLDLVYLSSGNNLVFLLSGAGDGTFSASGDYPTGTSPSDLAIFDLNKDTMLDILVGSYGYDGSDELFTVLLNQGDGGFSSSQFDARLSITGFFPGDFDNDGNIDILAGGFAPTVQDTDCYTDCLMFLPGYGDGTFETLPTAANFSRGGPYPMPNQTQKELLDIEGDGKADFVFPLAFDYRGGWNEVMVGHGDGNGAFTKKIWVASSGTTGTNSSRVDGGNPTAVVWGDFNEDGHQDLVIAEASSNARNGGLSIVPGRGKVDFSSPRVFRPARSLSTGTRSLAAGDFDNDGQTDVVLITDALDFMKGLGNGSFLTTGVHSSTSALGHIGGPGEFYNTVRAADFDLDGKLDVIFLATGGVQGGPKPRNVVAFGNGDGTFGRLNIFSNHNPEVDPDAGGANVVTSDFNGDGYADFAIWVYRTGDYSHILGHIEVYLNDPGNPGGFTRTAGHPEMDLGLLTVYPGHALAAGDFNNDGKADLIAHSTASFPDGSVPERVIVFAGKGDGTFEPAVSTSHGLPVMNDFSSADVNSDGNADLLGAGGNGAYVLLGKGNGAFDLPVYCDAGAAASSVKAADFDGDGKPDLAVGSGSSYVGFHGNGDGTFSAAQRFAIGEPVISYFETAYLNGDTKVDVVTLHSGQSNFVVTALLNDSGARADLSVSATRDTETSEVGQAVTHTVQVANNGPQTAAGVAVSLGVSARASVHSVTATKGTCTAGTNGAECTIDRIPAGRSVSIKLIVSPTAAVPLWLTTSTDALTKDPDRSNNGSSVSTGVVPALAPSSLTATTVSSSRIDLSWEETSQNETGFRIERKTRTDGTYSKVATVGADVTIYSDNGLSPGTIYYYRVRAYTGRGSSPYSNEAGSTTLRQYTIDVAKAGDGRGRVTGNPSGIDCGASCSATHDERTVVTLSARAGAGSAFMGWSGDCTGLDECTVTMDADRNVTATFGRLPLPPSSLGATAVSSTRVDLSWIDNSDNEEGFGIYRKTTDGTFFLAALTAPGATTFSDTSLTPGARYDYRVDAYNPAGRSAKSDRASAATPRRFFFTISKTTTDGAGGTVTSSPAGIDCGSTCWTYLDEGTAVTLTATPDPGTGFQGWSGGACTGKRKCTVTVTSDTDVGAAFGPLPAEPTSLAAKAVSSSRIDLSWTDNSSAEGGFIIQRKTGSAKFKGIARTGINATTFPDTGLEPGTMYTYRVRAYNSFGYSAFSNRESATTAP